MIIDCIADLHGYYPELEGGDLLIVAGNLTARDELVEHYQFGDWLKHQDYKKKVVIAGNHDNRFQELGIIPSDDYFHCSSYLCDSGIEFEGLKIWGSPWTLKFSGMNPKCMAFTCDTENEIAEKWKLIPDDVDILITHSPPYGILDGIPIEDGTVFHSGSKSLFGWLKFAIIPQLHIFGHIHEGYGEVEVFTTYNNKMMKSVNASYVNEHYKPVNKPVRIVL